jgi:sporulation protein YlmC with PRC-barrel domain
MINRIATLALSFVLCLVVNRAFAQDASRPPAQDAPVAGRVTIGVTVSEADLIATGWRASKLLGAIVQNDKGEKIGKIDDIIVAPGGTLSIAVIEVGGFLGIGSHRVGIPVRQLKFSSKAPKLTLPGGNKEALKALPQFEYAD